MGGYWQDGKFYKSKSQAKKAHKLQTAKEIKDAGSSKDMSFDIDIMPSLLKAATASMAEEVKEAVKKIVFKPSGHEYQTAKGQIVHPSYDDTITLPLKVEEFDIEEVPVYWTHEDIIKLVIGAAEAAAGEFDDVHHLSSAVVNSEETHILRLKGYFESVFPGISASLAETIMVRLKYIESYEPETHASSVNIVFEAETELLDKLVNLKTNPPGPPVPIPNKVLDPLSEGPIESPKFLTPKLELSVKDYPELFAKIMPSGNDPEAIAQMMLGISGKAKLSSGLFDALGNAAALKETTDGEKSVFQGMVEHLPPMTFMTHVEHLHAMLDQEQLTHWLKVASSKMDCMVSIILKMQEKIVSQEQDMNKMAALLADTASAVAPLENPPAILKIDDTNPTIDTWCGKAHTDPCFQDGALHVLGTGAWVRNYGCWEPAAMMHMTDIANYKADTPGLNAPLPDLHLVTWPGQQFRCLDGSLWDMDGAGNWHCNTPAPAPKS